LLVEVNDLEHVKAVGRILSRNKTLRLLASLAISPLPKRELAGRCEMAWSTAWTYLKELAEAGLTEEYFFTDGTSSMVMVRLKDTKIIINLDKVKNNVAKLDERPDTQAKPVD